MKTTEKARQVLNGLVERFKSGDIGPVIAESILKIPEGMEIPMRKWSAMNQLLCWLSGTMDARGIAQWRAVGRKIKKGASACYILVPMQREAEESDDGDETVENVRKSKILVGFRTAPVFAYEMTEGEPLYPDLEPREKPPLMEVAKRYGLEVVWQPSMRGEYGYYDPKKGLISLSSHGFSTFFHELSHAVDRRIRGELKPGQDPKQEAVAELSACVLASLYGYDYSGNCWKYLEQYREKTGKSTISLVSEVMEQTMKVIEAIWEPSQGERVA